jgi:hypothetical protein
MAEIFLKFGSKLAMQATPDTSVVAVATIVEMTFSDNLKLPKTPLDSKFSINKFLLFIF